MDEPRTPKRRASDHDSRDQSHCCQRRRTSPTLDSITPGAFCMPPVVTTVAETPASVLRGDLAILIDTPQKLLMRQQPETLDESLATGGTLEAMFADEARAMHELNADGVGLSLADERVKPQEPMASSPAVACLPSFGLGLSRQRSFAPPEFLTDAENAELKGMQIRCVAAFGRLVRHAVRRKASMTQSAKRHHSESM